MRSVDRHREQERALTHNLTIISSSKQRVKSHAALCEESNLPSLPSGNEEFCFHLMSALDLDR